LQGVISLTEIIKTGVSGNVLAFRLEGRQKLCHIVAKNVAKRAFLPARRFYEASFLFIHLYKNVYY
jgi:hypothetical protein